MKVIKFGGSSVAKPERIRGIVRILQSYQSRKIPFTVVFSAFGGVTDSLIEMAKKASEADVVYMVLYEQFKSRHVDSARALLSAPRYAQIQQELETSCETLLDILRGIYLVREASARTMDYVLSFGERSSNFIISHVLDEAGVAAEYLDARKVIVTDKAFGSAKVDFEATYPTIKKYYAEHQNKVQVATGFIGAAKGGLTTTLGRGGSDYTAAILAAGLEAECIEIWTDVDGVLTADPRKVKKAFTIPTMTYAEAMEMSHFGAKVIYPPTLQPALAKNIPLYIKNTFNPDFAGTFISDALDPEGHDVKGISSISNISLLTLHGSGLFGVPGIAGRLFGALALAGINIILITQGSSESSISFAVSPQDSNRAKRKVEKEFEFEMHNKVVAPVIIETDLAVVAIVGENMRFRPGIAGRMFQGLGKNGVNCVAIAQGSSELNVSVVINRADETKALNALHEAFFLSDTKDLHVYMVGSGLIGSTLLEQIKAQSEHLRDANSLEIKIMGLANSRRMLIDPKGIDLNHWKEQLAGEGETMSMDAFVARMKQLNLSNTIFIDNTASDTVPQHYEQILDASISISTPNKVAASSGYAQYHTLKAVAKRRGVKFAYETNVGAGLPVISTLKDLINSGDRIRKIEGVLSGSLSYIFNNFTAGTRFADIVKQAGELGYTEPDPRIDLNGIDVRRKLIILARESGLALESADVQILPFLPKSSQEAVSIADFHQSLSIENTYFEDLQKKATKEGKVLRMIAKVENNTASIGLEALDAKSPFFLLSGSDNMIVFTTDRYHDRPLVVRGPGAGAEVTAAGVFAEIIRIGNFL
jgi:bifunctional aspartokinase / homoserine dehydrogenase 1